MNNIINQLSNQALKRSEVSMGETNYAFAFGFMNSQVAGLLDEILTVKQKKKLQEMVNSKEV